MNRGNSRNTYTDLDGKKNAAGKNISYYRIQNKLSAQNLSDRLSLLGLDLHRQAIFQIEAGKRTITDYELALIAKVLNVTPNDLLSHFDFLNNKS